MLRHRAQHGDDRTHAEAGRERQEEALADPVTAARVRSYLYMERLAMQTGDRETDDIEFAALTGPSVGPVAPAYEGSLGGREILAGRPNQTRLTGIS
jgi:hypothetical protein|tara:strand:+ start:17876 stop:18166 length:291 start_codon:yes stop_codon:yes gene_type:complete